MGALVTAAAGYLAGPGHRVARRVLAGLGLPADLADDVGQEALIRALRAEQRGVEVENVEAFTTHLVQRAAHDLLRGLRRRPDGHLVDAPPSDLDDVDEPADEPVLAGLDTIAVRRELARQLVTAARAAAGGLAVVAATVDGAEPAEDCPQPKAGAGEAEALAWIGLFYGGRRDCFPAAGAADDPATRKRRSRASREQRQVLEEALASIAVEVPGG